MVLGSWSVTVLALFPSSVARAQVQLSEPLPRETIGGVNGFVRSPDGTSLIYDSDERTDEVFELFSVPADGSSAPVVLSGSLVPGGDLGGPLGILSSYACAPDGTWVAFLADATLDGVHELYRAPLDGSSRLTLSGPLVAGGGVSSFRIAPDGDSIVFLADAEVDERFELFRVPADGSGPRVKLSGVLVNGGDVADFELGASSVRAYYRADAALDDVIELYSVPIDGSLGAVRLNDALPSGRSVVDFRIASDEGRVAFRADGVSDDVHELFSVPADRSSAPVKLNPTPVTDGDVSANYSIDPSDTRLAFLADLDTNDVQELYSVPLDGSAATIKLHPSSSSVHAFRFTPDGSSVLFGGNVGPVRGLFRVPSNGGTPALRSDSLASTAVASPLEFSADGSTCLYVQNHTILDPFGGFLGSYENLHATGVASGPPIALTTESSSGSSYNPVLFPKLSVDGASVFFMRLEFNTYSLQVVPIDASLAPRAIAFTDTPWGCAEVEDGLVLPLESRLSRVALDGSEVLPLSGPLLLGAVVGDVAEFEPTPDGLQVVYRTTFEERLRVVGVGGGSPARELVAPDDPRGIAQPGSIVLAPDSRSVAFLQMSRVLGRVDLYSASLRTAEAPRRINDPVAQGTLSSMAALESRFTLDGTRIVFAATLGNTPYALFLAPLDGSVPARRLNGSGADARLWDGAIVSSDERAFALTSDGSRVVYSATTTSGSRHNLFSATLATSSTPVQLTNLTVDGTSVYGNWELTSDGSRVVYMADQDVRFRSELYSVPVDGSAAPVKLNPPLVSGGSVGTWVESATLLPYVRLTPGGTRAVYLADQVTDEKQELFSVPVDGSAAAVKLSGALIASGDVQPGFQLDPAGARVFFMADAQSDGVFELFVAPIDGSAGRIKLSGTLVTGGDVQALVTREGLVHFGSGRVVYTADALTNDVVELFSVPVDGSAPPVRLNAALPTGGNVLTESVLVTADGSTVLYRADQTTNDVFELWRVPIDGSSAPVRVNLALPTGGDVEPDLCVIARGNRLFYRADQDVNDEFELYTLRLAPRTPRGPASSAAPTGTATRQL